MENVTRDGTFVGTIEPVEPHQIWHEDGLKTEHKWEAINLNGGKYTFWCRKSAVYWLQILAGGPKD